MKNLKFLMVLIVAQSISCSEESKTPPGVSAEVAPTAGVNAHLPSNDPESLGSHRHEGGIVMSLERRVSLAQFKVAVGHFEHARSRPAMDQEFVALLGGQGPSGFGLLDCPAQQPLADGNGCVVRVSSMDPIRKGQISFSFVKRVNLLALKEFVSASETLLEASDLQSEEHVQLGKPFLDTESESHHMHCQSEGAVGERKWACYLFLSKVL